MSARIIVRCYCFLAAQLRSANSNSTQSSLGQTSPARTSSTQPRLACAAQPSHCMRSMCARIIVRFLLFRLIVDRNAHNWNESEQQMKRACIYSLRGKGLLYKCPGGNQVDGLPPVASFSTYFSDVVTRRAGPARRVIYWL